MQKYDTILFDADGTLFDFLRGERVALISALEMNGYYISEEDVGVYSAINDSLWKALERGEVDKETLKTKRFEIFTERKGFNCNVKKLATDYTDQLSEQHFLIEGALDAVTALSEKCRLYIITNGISYVQRNRFSNSPVNEFIRELFISEEVGYEKPSVHYFEYVESKIDNFDASKTLVVGDSLTSDMQGGVNAGLDCCYFNSDGKKIPEESPLYGKVKYTISRLDELIYIVS
ncbi:MAG: YjjG family noncanonical pyrimidine nucleotidase [Clostridia bacterium]|nr:YjjG family noncanonical pyrimidine nucleotidase [Clostridia bacterium]